jgi:hypothetical protein
VHPAVLDAYVDGSISKAARRVRRAVGTLTESETAVLGLLKKRAG